MGVLVEKKGSVVEGRTPISIEFLADDGATEAIELVRLNIPLGVLDGRAATSLVTVPRAGLYIASGIFGIVGTALFTCGRLGMSLGPPGFPWPACVPAKAS